MKNTVYILQDYENEIIGIYSSFEKAKKGLIGVIKESIISYKYELNKYEDENVYTVELRRLITELEESIESVQKATPKPYYSYDQLYLTEYIFD